MTPTVLERLGVRAAPLPVRRGEADRGLMARALMYLFFAGSAITVGSLLLGGNVEGADQARMIVMSAGGSSIALVLFAGYDRLPRWVFPLFLACGTLLIEWTIYASDETASPYAMFWFWLAIYSFYFFPRWLAFAELGFIALAYAAVLTLAQDTGSEPLVRWAVTTSALIVAGAMIGLLKERLDDVIAKLHDLSRADSETGLLNRRAFVENLNGAVELARRTSGRMTLVVGELAPGGELARAGRALAGAVRSSDIPARIGERTFAVVAPGTGDHGGFVLAEQIQRTLGTGGMSFGVASFPQHASSVDELTCAAHGALAEALSLGTGRVVTAGRAYAAA
ncbi:MAG: hypothetical protein QOJ97_892 [Solirubrobacteraceae bacterium]|nr:hypothetical protein [Solirubrobacteraceae bacterium]